MRNYDPFPSSVSVSQTPVIQMILCSTFVRERYCLYLFIYMTYLSSRERDTHTFSHVGYLEKVSLPHSVCVNVVYFFLYFSTSKQRFELFL